MKIKLNLAASIDSTPPDRFSIVYQFSFLLESATEFFFLKNWTVVEETYTFMEISWAEISRDLEISKRDLFPYE